MSHQARTPDQITMLLLERARHDAQARGVEVDYVPGDMRRLPWATWFNRGTNWFTSFGYFADPDNRRVLAECARALRPGGRLALELMHYTWLLRNYQPAIVIEREGDLLIDRNQLDPLTGCTLVERTVIRGGRVRQIPFFVRLFSFTELRDWLLDTGFTSVAGYGQDGNPLTAESQRMSLVAHR